MRARPSQLLGPLLRDVSRSFYTTLRVLPAAVRPQIGLAYLLARATDTIADTPILPVADRLHALNQLRARILSESETPLDFAPFTRHHAQPSSGSTPAERQLLDRIEEALAVLPTFATEDQQHIRNVLGTITRGQELDLQRFGAAGPSPPNLVPPPIAALQSAAELDDYTYRVAGCVGEFWTRICRAHLFPDARLDEAALIANGIRFGKGLQLVNILRDVPADLRKGRCYLPLSELKSAGLTPNDLLQPHTEAQFRRVYDPWLGVAEGHLRAGWIYTQTLPWRSARIRLACAWPILIGSRTLSRLRQSQILDATQRVKISRAAVRNIMLRSVFLYPLPPLWRRLHP